MIPTWKRPQIEDLALITLLEFRRQTGLPLAPPLDVDLVGEITCGLMWDWDVLPEPPRTTVWAGLFPRERRVVLNERHKDKFAAKTGLERFTKAHEIGHWILHVADDAKVHPPLHRRSDGQTIVFYHEESLHPKNAQTHWLEKHADWFAGALLLPAAVFVPVAEQYDLSSWRSLYELARLFDVTISTLCVRLAHLNLARVDANGNIHRGAKPVVAR